MMIKNAFGLLRKVSKTFLVFLSSFFHHIFGHIQWSPPAWLKPILRVISSATCWIKISPFLFLANLILTVLVVGGSYTGYLWWQLRPKPIRVTFEIIEPTRTEIEAEEESRRAPKPLTLIFSDSVAPLAMVDNEVSKGISLTPPLTGLWRWRGDRTLVFSPTSDWPIGSTYTVKFQPELFKPKVLLEKNQANFSSPQFNIKIADAKFYQDPLKPEEKKGIIQLVFSYPVNPVELEKRIELTLGDEKPLFAVSYDSFKLKAFVHSILLPIPKDPQTLTFNLDAGVSAMKGGKSFSEKLTQKISIPDLHSLSITHLTPEVVTNDRDEPEQVLMIDSSTPVHESEMNKAISMWILPKFHPDHPPEDPSTEDPYYWSESEITSAILQKSTKLTPEPIPNAQEYVSTHSYKYRAAVGDRLFVEVNQNLKSFGGYLLPKNFSRIVEVPAFPAELKILSQGALLALSGEKKVAVLARDLPGIKIEIGRVLPSQIQHLVTQSDGSFTNPQFSDFSPDNIVERFEKKVKLPNLKEGQAHYESIDMGEYLRAPGMEEKRGVFLLTVKNYDPVQEEKKAKCLAKNERQTGEAPPDSAEAEEGEYGYEGEGSDEEDCESILEESEYSTESNQDSRMVLVTDLGILIKKWLDGTQEVFVQSIFSGQPVAGATVEIVGKNGTTLFSQVTDVEGRARFSKIENLSRERKPTLILVRKGTDLSFMPLSLTQETLDFSRFDIGGIRNAQVADQVNAYLFSDRGIYRPGDTFHMGMIVKPARWETPIVGLPLEAEILDSRGLTLKREKIKLPAGGFMELSHTLEESAPTGTYDINLYLVKDNKTGAQIGSGKIKVQEFLPDRMKVTAKLSSEVNQGWLAPDGLKALVNAQNLFGTPAENRRVAADMTLNPSYPHFSSYADYEFYDPHRAKEGYSEQLGEGKTDIQGNAEFDLHLEKYAKATYQLHFQTLVFEPEGGRSVAAEVATLVSDLPYLIGFKADGSLDYVSRNSQRQVSLIAIDPKLQKTSVKGLTLQRIEIQYVSVLNKQEDGTYHYESRKKEVMLKESPLEIAAEGFTLTLDTATPGNFSYTIRDAQGTELNRFSYSVAGQGNVTRNLERNAELQLTLNKKQYAPGEEIEVSVRAPYVGAGLITIEREKVYAVRWFKTNTLASVQKIRLPQDFEGNGYVSVQFIRDPGSDEIFMSPLSYGVAPFSGTLDARTNPIKLSVPKLIRPGETLKIQVESTKPTRVAVFAVDEGILQVAAYRLPNPLGFFFQKKMLEVKTSQILDLILPEFKKLLLASAPGGDAESELGKRLNPFKRKRDKPVVYWSGIVDLNHAQEFSYPVPNYFNGTLRVMAVAVNEASVGVRQTESQVRGDFVLSPNAPSTVTPSDEFEVSVGVANNVAGSGKEAAITLTLKTPPQLQILGEPTQTLKIDEQHESVALYRIKVAEGDKAQLGSATLNFTATLGEKSAEISTDVSVRPAMPHYTQVSMGTFTDQVDIPIKRDLYPQYREVEAGVSLLPLVFASGLSHYLQNFEHLCTEQLVSQAMSTLILSRRPEFGKETSPSSRSLEQTFNILRTRQNAEGGFGLWVASVNADEFASVYAVHLLLEAEERGEPIPSDLLKSGLDYIQALASSPGQSLWELRVRAYAAYLLTRHQVVTTPILTTLRETLENRYPQDWKNDLTALYFAASYQMLKQDSLAEELIEEGFAKWPSSHSFSYDHYYDPLIRDSQTLYLFARHFPKRVKNLPASVLADFSKPIAEGRFNTLSSAYLILAFDAYANQVGATATDKLKVVAKNAQGTPKLLDLPANLVPRVPLLPETTQLHLTNSSGFNGYYAVSESGFDKAPPQTELRQGMEIQRDYLDASGTPVTSVQLGDEITVRLRFRTVDRPTVYNAALIDLLPGGFEPVLNLKSENAGSNSTLGGLSGAQATSSIEYADAREDRVIFYGSVFDSVSEVSYRIKATNTGLFVIPSAYGESMYEREVQARSVGGQTLTVMPATR